MGPETVDDYIYYPECWKEKGRYPYSINYQSEMVGFVLVRTIFENDKRFHQVSDFYIQPQHEGKVYGTRAVSKLWSLYPGR
jgi:predicted acetyltransferase